MKRCIGIFLASILVLTAAACSKSAPAPETTPSTVPAASTAGSPAKPVTLKLGVPNGNSLTPLVLVDNFKAKFPNITVVTDKTPWSDFKTKLKTQIAASNPPDVFIMDSGYNATLGAMGAALDLSGLIGKDLNAEDFTASLFAAKAPDGKVYGIPQAINVLGVAYNKKLFDEAQIPYPKEDWTWQDMMDIAEKLTKDTDNDGQPDVYGLLVSQSITNGWLPFVLSTGGSPLDETKTKSMFGDPKTAEGLAKYEAAVYDLKVVPPQAWVTANVGHNQAFYGGKAGMLFMLASSAADINKNAPDLDWDVQMMPVGWDGNRHVIYVPNNWIIFSKSGADVQAAAWEWIKFYLSEESQNLYAQTCPGGYPIRKSALDIVAKTDTKPANKNAFITGVDKYGITLFENSTYEQWKPEVDKVIKDLYLGNIKSADAAKQIDKTVQDILDSEAQ